MNRAAANPPLPKRDQQAVVRWHDPQPNALFPALAHRLEPPVDLLGGNVFFVRANRPNVPEGVGQRPSAVAVKLIGYRTRSLAAGRDRLGEETIHILHVQADAED